MKFPEVFSKDTSFELLVDFLHQSFRIVGLDVRKLQCTSSHAKPLAHFVPCLMLGVFQLTSVLGNFSLRALGTATIVDLTVINMIVKIFAIAINAKEVDAILHTIVLYTCSEIRLATYCAEERELIAKYTRLTQKTTVVSVMSFAIGTSVVYIMPYLISLIVPHLWIIPNEYKIPGVPVDSHPGYDLHTYLVQLAAAYISVMFMSCCLLFLYCAMYIALQCDICTLYVRQLNDGDLSDQLQRIIEKHTHVFQFCNLTSNLMELIIMVEMLFGILYIVICITLFTEDPMFFLIILFLCDLQLLIYCYFGQIIINKAFDTAEAIYLCDWLQFSRRSDQTSYLQLVRGSQMDLAIRPFRTFSLSLATFVQILKTAYSYNAFLQNIV